MDIHTSCGGRMDRSHVQIRRTLLLLSLALAAGCDEGLTAPEVVPEVETFVAMMNAHRVSVGCEPLTWITEVADVAHAHSVDMVERDFFDHTNPDGASPFDRMRDAGLNFSRAAENIAWGYGSPEAVLEGWLNSSGHRANIENCSLTEHGVGLYQTRWTHLFRTP